MQKLLQKLYYGSMDELDGVVRSTAEYKKALHKYQDSRESLEKKLPTDLLKEFQTCITCCRALECEAEEAAFSCGARFGITMMMEVFFLSEAEG